MIRGAQRPLCNAGLYKSINISYIHILITIRSLLWQGKAGNGEVIAVGEAYESKAGCLNGIESIRKNAPDATVVEIENN